MPATSVLHRLVVVTRRSGDSASHSEGAPSSGDDPDPLDRAATIGLELGKLPGAVPESEEQADSSVRRYATRRRANEADESHESDDDPEDADPVHEDLLGRVADVGFELGRIPLDPAVSVDRVSRHDIRRHDSATPTTESPPDTDNATSASRRHALAGLSPVEPVDLQATVESVPEEVEHSSEMDSGPDSSEPFADWHLDRHDTGTYDSASDWLSNTLGDETPTNTADDHEDDPVDGFDP